MKINEKVTKAIDLQINREMWSSNLYLSMSMYLQHKGYAGMAKWLMAQSKEEMEHAYDMMNFVNRRGGRVTILPLEEVPTEFGSVADTFTQVYEHFSRLLLEVYPRASRGRRHRLQHHRSHQSLQGTKPNFLGRRTRQDRALRSSFLRIKG